MTNLAQPLAEQLRPQTLDEYIGQEHLVGEGAILRRALDSGRIPSMIFFGDRLVSAKRRWHLLSPKKPTDSFMF